MSQNITTLKARVPRGRTEAELSVLVYVSQSKGDLEELYHLMESELRKTGRSFEFVFVDDGNERETFESLKRLHNKYSDIKLVRLSRTFGESVGLTVGFERASGDVIVLMSSYMQVDPLEVEKLIARVMEGSDLVVGWRYPRVDPLLNRWQSKWFNWVTRKMTGADFHDLNCTLRVCKRSVLEEIPIYGDLHRFLPILAHRQGFKVEEVKVKHREEKGETGLYSLGLYVRRFLDILTLFFLIKFTRKPLRFFGLIGTTILGSGFLINLYLAIVRLTGQAGIAGRPLLLLGVLLMTLGVQTISIGLIGEIIIFTHAKQLKEYRVRSVL